MPDGTIIPFDQSRRPAQEPEEDTRWVSDYLTRLYPEMIAVIRAHRASCNDGCEECRNPTGPLTLKDVALAALHLADIARAATWEIGHNRKRARESKRSKYVTPADRPWDYYDVDQEESLSDVVTLRIEQAKLLLAANDPEAAADQLKYAAHRIQDGITRAEALKRAKKRAEREAQRRERQRLEIEAEERRLARERERVRKQLAKAAAAS